MSSPPPADPPSTGHRDALDAAVEHLALAGDVRGVLCLVERWAAAEPPTRRARLHEVRALLSLCLVDRAGLLLEQIRNEDPLDREAVALQARLFSDRGWTDRARRLLAEALERHPGAAELERLLTETATPPPAPPADTQALERSGTARELVEAAERLLETGSTLPARALLDRALALDPADVRARDLLWGLSGSFETGTETADALARRLAPEVYASHGWDSSMEDGDVVIPGPRGARRGSPPAPPGRPIRVVERVSTTGPLPPRGLGTATLPVESSVLDTRSMVRHHPTLRRRRRLRIAATLATGLALGVLGIVILSSRGNTPGDRASRVIAADDFPRLLQTETFLQKGAESGDPAALAALARVEIVLWNEYVSNPERLDRARTLVGRALGAAPEDPHVRLAHAELASAEDRLADARRAIGGLEGPDAALLAAALAEADGDLVVATASARAATRKARRSVRAWRVLASLQRRSGDVEGARASLDRAHELDPQNVRIDVEKVLLEHRDDPADLGTALQTLDARLHRTYSAQRVHSAALLEAANRLGHLGDEPRRAHAVERALAVGGMDPDLLTAGAIRDIEAQRLGSAREALRRAAGWRPGDLVVQGLLLCVLLDQDRLAEAHAVLAAVAATRPLHPWLPVLQAWADVVGASWEAAPDARIEARLEHSLALDPGNGEVLWLLGYALAPHRPEEALPLLVAAQAILQAPSSCGRQALYPRTLAARVLARDPEWSALEAQALAEGGTDPWVHLVLARAAGARGDRKAAAAALDRAVETGPEMARAWFEQGAFLRQEAGGRAAPESLQRYLDLQPNGPRAEMARSWLDSAEQATHRSP
ncbi:MAG: hypothetical protein JXB39_05775 [Deltaproteobacteria bacterium]|nr:hypothetical protein [Deltaproteobacteria bacterium]